MDKSSIQNQNARIKAELFIDGKWVEGEGKERNRSSSSIPSTIRRSVKFVPQALGYGL